MALHFCELGSRELPGLVENMFWYREFAKIVKECRCGDRMQLILGVDLIVSISEEFRQARA
jgi:hypothetical protein